MIAAADRRFQGLLDFDPFARIDEEGVGGLINMAVDKARTKQPETKVKKCGALPVLSCWDLVTSVHTLLTLIHSFRQLYSLSFS